MNSNLIEIIKNQYKEKNIFVWGASGGGKVVKELLEKIGVKIFAFVDSDSNKWGACYESYNVISPKQLQQEALTEKNILVQIASSYETEIANKLEQIGITEYIGCGEMSFIQVIKLWTMFTAFQEDKKFYQYYLKHVVSPSAFPKILWTQYFDKCQTKQSIDSICICCMPPKTGNVTVYNCIKENCASSVLCVETWHTAAHVQELIRVANASCNKIITAVREPIAQNLSVLFQIAYDDKYFFDLPVFWENDYSKLLQQMDDMDSGRNRDNNFYQNMLRESHATMLIQNFFEKQFKNKLGIDLLAEPFDTEKGFSVIKQNGIEIFIYQLEKIDSVRKDLLAFAGLDADIEFEKLNNSENKYYNSLYQQAKKTIRFSREYFEKTFANPYMTHFYSRADIQKFRKKWEKHIVEE